MYPKPTLYVSLAHISKAYSITRTIDGITYHIAIADTAGQEEYRGMWANTNLAADAFLLVYDITRAHTLTGLEYFNNLVDMESNTRLDLLNHIPSTGLIGGKGKARVKEKARNGIGLQGRLTDDGRRNLSRPVKLVVGNKCDLASMRQVTAKTGLEWSRSRGCGFMETSAKDVVNIEESLELLVRWVVEARQAGGAWDSAGNIGGTSVAGGRVDSGLQPGAPTSPRDGGGGRRRQHSLSTLLEEHETDERRRSGTTVAESGSGSTSATSPTGSVGPDDKSRRTPRFWRKLRY
jgi:GTPase SAR1 family protein